MVLCKFFQQGNCRFGNNCRFEHTLANNSSSNNRDQSSGNRFGAFGGNSANNATRNGQSLMEKYNISTDIIKKDLTDERPQWILSAYGPGRNAPDQLFGGYPREQSFEEVRLHFMNGKASGNEQQALSQAQELYQVAESQMQNALSNLQQAATYVVEGETRHPNRHDVCKEGTQGQPSGKFSVGQNPNASGTAASNPFAPSGNTFGSGGGTGNAGGFGQPPALGQLPNPFGQPTQSSTSSSNPFGAPAQTNAAAANPFGAPSQPNAAQPSPFDAPSQPKSSFGSASGPSAFGQPTTLGAKPNPFGTPAFGQAAQPTAPAASGFGQASQLGQPANPFGSAAGSGPSAFGAAGTAAPANPFGTAAGNNQGPAASNPFAVKTEPTSNASPFASSETNNTAAASNPFGSGNSGNSGFSSNAFGSNNASNNQAAPERPSPFGSSAPGAGSQPASNPFGSTEPQTNGFGKPASNPFGQPSAPAFGQTTAPANPFGTSLNPPQGATNQNNPYPPDSTKEHPPLSSYANTDGTGRLTQFKGKAVTYKDSKPGIQGFDGTWLRIWYPAGPPGYSKDTEPPKGELGAAAVAAWTAFAQMGQFQGGLMPEVAPPREVVKWDF